MNSFATNSSFFLVPLRVTCMIRVIRPLTYSDPTLELHETMQTTYIMLDLSCLKPADFNSEATLTCFAEYLTEACFTNNGELKTPFRNKSPKDITWLHCSTLIPSMEPRSRMKRKLFIGLKKKDTKHLTKWRYPIQGSPGFHSSRQNINECQGSLPLILKGLESFKIIPSRKASFSNSNWAGQHLNIPKDHYG